MKNIFYRINVYMFLFLFSRQTFSVQPTEELFGIQRDSVIKMINKAIALNRGGDIINSGEMTKSAEKYFYSVKGKQEENGYKVDMDRIRFMIEKLKAWNSSLMGKYGLAEQYLLEALHMTKDSYKLTYSFLLTTYGDLLIATGRSRLAEKLIFGALSDPEYMQEYIFYISRSFDFYTCFILCNLSQEKIKSLRSEKTLLPDDENLLSKAVIPQEKLIQLIGVTESFPTIQQIITKIKQNPDNKSLVLSQVRELDNILSPLKSRRIKKEIGYYIEYENRKFYDKLKETHPDLSLTNLRLCTLIKLGMDTKEIAVLTNKTVRGIESAKFRLRKKLNLDTSYKDLYNYFLKLEKEVE